MVAYHHRACDQCHRNDYAIVFILFRRGFGLGIPNSFHWSGSEFSVTLALSGYQPQTVSVRPEAQGASAAPRLAPNPVQVTLQAVTTSKKPIAKKKKPVAAAARPSASRPLASAAPTAAPARAPTATPALAPAPSSSVNI